MATIYLLRHAKSRWDEPATTDHDRSLAPRGERDAPAMGAHAAAQGWLPDLVLCSTARRAVMTAEAFLEAAGAKPEVRHDRSIYMASAAHLLALLHQQRAASVMLVGHDPGIHDLALLLTGATSSRPLREKFSTAALAVIEFEGSTLAEIEPGTGLLTAFVRPKDLRS